ncbi:MAG TPA: NYN domain-containing protein [Thermoanaerobaculia bacterium]|nr:NYN domain-containing protein [Thermoanaerobaculia bacterium]
MSFLVDGSNLLGHAGKEREAVEAKRRLAQALTGLARSTKKKVTLYFDGNKPDGFGAGLGAVTVVFGGDRSADDKIATRCREGSDSFVVFTSDGALASRIRGRRVDVRPVRELISMLESLPPADNPSSPMSDSWEAYFSDEKNRTQF